MIDIDLMINLHPINNLFYQSSVRCVCLVCVCVLFSEFIKSFMHVLCTHGQTYIWKWFLRRFSLFFAYLFVRFFFTYIVRCLQQCFNVEILSHVSSLFWNFCCCCRQKIACWFYRCMFTVHCYANVCCCETQSVRLFLSPYSFTLAYPHCRLSTRREKNLQRGRFTQRIKMLW